MSLSISNKINTQQFVEDAITFFINEAQSLCDASTMKTMEMDAIHSCLIASVSALPYAIILAVFDHPPPAVVSQAAALAADGRASILPSLGQLPRSPAVAWLRWAWSLRGLYWYGFCWPYNLPAYPCDGSCLCGECCSCQWVINDQQKTATWVVHCDCPMCAARSATWSAVALEDTHGDYLAEHLSHPETTG